MSVSECTVLVCDDSILARKRLKTLLEANGITQIVEATNGQEAIDRYKEHTPDIVFMDIVMPVKDGVQAVKEITEFNAEAYIVMVSSVGTKEYLRDAIKEGAKEFIQKPIEDGKFAEFLQRIIKGGH